MSDLNLNYLVSEALQPVYPQVTIQVFKYLGQVNNLGTITTSYAAPFTITANVQLVDKQRLTEMAGYNKNTIYKCFWINNEYVTGLNRNIGTGGDYIVHEGLKYKVVGIENEYNTDWVAVIGAESVIDE